jgi:hypothetical protein
MKKKHHKKNGLDIDKFNKMIDQAAKIVECDAECQRTKRQELLKKKFIDARANLQTAPDQLSLASKQYFAFSNGKTKYEEITTQELVKKSKLLSAEIASNFLSETDIVRNSLQDYSDALTDAKMANEYNNELIKKIVQLQNILYDEINGTVTNNRKSYYENESMTNLRKWNYIFMIVFYVLVIGLSVSFVMVPNTNSTAKKIVICVLLVLYPFYILYVANIFGRLYNSVLDILPKNVYNNI